MNLNSEAGPEGTNIMDDVRNLNAPSVARRAKAWIARVIPLSTIFKVVTGCALLIRPTQTQYASSVCRISAAHPANPLAAQISSSRSMSIASVCAKNWNVRMELWLLLSQDSGMRDDLVEHAQADDNIVDFAIQYPAGAAGFSVHRRYR
jgi:hypothetical protein